jgi:uroporphyrin-3 C-methyltransferase
MNENVTAEDKPASVLSAASPPAEAVASAALAPAAAPVAGNGWWIALGLAGVVSVAAITLALLGHQRIKSLEQELVRRQQDSQGQAIEAHAMAKQAQEAARSAESKVGLLEARVAETVLQRSQLEDLIQQLSRSRDENVLADVDAAVRVAVQQSAITGSAEPLVSALRQAEERLARMNQPRLERVRRSLARDLDRVRAVAVTDLASLTIKIDEVVRTVDELPLVSQPERRAAAARPAASASDGAAPGPGAWLPWLQERWAAIGSRIWVEVRSLVRVTQIDKPEAMLVAPDQAWFLRENLKLRLLNARLSLLSRQFDIAQADLREAQAVLERYFDRNARRVALTIDLVRQVTGQSRQLTVPRPDETLAALAAAQAGR